MFDNTKEQRFEFTITVTPKSKGDYGSVRIGGLMRDLKDCLSEFRNMKEAILRHVDGVQSVEITVEDYLQEFESITGEYDVREASKKDLNNLKRIGENDGE